MTEKTISSEKVEKALREISIVNKDAFISLLDGMNFTKDQKNLIREQFNRINDKITESTYKLKKSIK